MNATLQFLMNTESLTKYLLKESNFTTIMNNCNLYELTSGYCQVLSNCYKENIKCYNPKKFKEIISEKNQLFSGTQENDSKNLIDFILEELNNELKQLEFKKSSNDNINFNQNYSNIDLSNKEQSMNYFKLMTQKQDKSIISKNFFLLNENIKKCLFCNDIKYNYQMKSNLEFDLQAVYDFSNKNKNIQTSQRRKIDLYMCFSQYFEPNYFKGNKQIFCSNCKKLENGLYYNKIYSLPPILIFSIQ